MVSIHVKARVGSDGIVTVKVPDAFRETDVDALLVLQSAESKVMSVASESREWPPGFFERTAGAWQGEPLVRGEQGEHDIREEWT